MAKIDEGSFGFRSPNVTPQAVPTPGELYDRSGSNAVEAGFRDLSSANTDKQIVERNQLYATNERSRHELATRLAEENRSRSAAAIVDYDLGVRQVGESVAEQLQGGQIQREDVVGKFKEAEAKLRADTMGQVPPDQQDLVNPRLAKAAERVQFGLGLVVEKHRKASILGNLESIRDGMGKMAIEPDANLPQLHSEFAQAAGVLGPNGGLDPKQVPKLVQDFKDKTTSDHLVARLNDNNDDLAGLYELKKVVKDQSQFPNLDPERRNVIIHQIDARAAHLEARQAADGNRVLAELATDMQNTQKALLDGYPPNAKQLLDLQQRSKGTALEPHYAQLAQTSAYVSKFVGAPLSTMQSELLRLDKEVRTKPSPEGVSMLSSLKQLIASKSQNLTEHPYAQSVQDGAPFVAIDWSSQVNLDSTLRSRVAAVKGQARTNPGSSQGIFLEGEARTFNDFVKTQPPQDVALLMQRLVTSINDPTVTAHTMKQVSKESPALASAGWLASQGQMDASIAVLDGDRVLHGDGKHGAMNVPADEKFRDGWRSRVGNAYAGKPQPEDMDFETAKTIYASLARKAGKTAQTDVDTGIWRKAIDMATGGIYEHNGANVALPYGVSASQFANRAQVALDRAFNSSEIAGAGASGTMKAGKVDTSGMTTAEKYHAEYEAKAAQSGQTHGINTEPLRPEPDTVKGGQLSRGYLHDLPLETIGHGQYRVVQGSSYVVNDAGYPLVLDLRKDPPTYRFETSGGALKPQVHVENAGVDEYGNPYAPAFVRGAPGASGNERIDRLTHPGEQLQLNPATAAPLDKQQMKRDRKKKD